LAKITLLPSQIKFIDVEAGAPADIFQVTPSVEVKTVLLPEAITEKIEPLQVMADQLAEAGKVRAVQEIPSGEVIAFVVPVAITQNTLPFHAMQDQVAVEGSAFVCVQVMPSSE
jgi:hypothetical protein